MKVLDIIKTVGAGLLSSTPAGAAALTLVNSFLPKEKQLPETATGKDAQGVIDQLPPQMKASIQLAEIDLEKAKVNSEVARYQAMCQADNQETRAKAVMRAMNALIGLTALFIVVLAILGFKHGIGDINTALVGVFLAVTAPFAYVVRAYMGDLSRETESRHSMEDGSPRAQRGLIGAIQAFKGVN